MGETIVIKISLWDTGYTYQMGVEPKASCWQYLYIHGHCQKEETEDPYDRFNDVQFKGNILKI